MAPPPFFFQSHNTNEINISSGARMSSVTHCFDFLVLKARDVYFDRAHKERTSRALLLLLSKREILFLLETTLNLMVGA